MSTPIIFFGGIRHRVRGPRSRRGQKYELQLLFYCSSCTFYLRLSIALGFGAFLPVNSLYLHYTRSRKGVVKVQRRCLFPSPRMFDGIRG
eukprot:336433-Pyramimonas_sp.AAC.2